MISSPQLRAESSYCNCHEQTDDAPTQPVARPARVGSSIVGFRSRCYHKRRVNQLRFKLVILLCAGLTILNGQCLAACSFKVCATTLSQPQPLTTAGTHCHHTGTPAGKKGTPQSCPHQLIVADARVQSGPLPSGRAVFPTVNVLPHDLCEASSIAAREEPSPPVHADIASTTILRI